MLIFFPPLRLGVLAAYVVVVSTAPSISTAPGVTNAANLDDPGPSTDLAPGDPMNATHDFLTADSFVQSGRGDHSIELANHFTHVDADDTPEDLHATVEGIADVKLSGPLAAPRHVHDRRWHFPRYERCAPREVEDIETVLTSAQKDAKRASTGIWNLKESDKDGWAVRYKRWFGPYTEPRHKTVKDVLFDIERKALFRNFVFLCRTGERETTPARLFTDPKKIEVFQGFWDSPTAARIDTLIRLAASRNRHIKNVVADVGGAREPSLSKSNDALFNFANYDAFIQNRGGPLPAKAAVPAAPTDP